MPRVSVLVTCYNAAEWIGECVESVKSQTFTDWECLIGDDCSTDETFSMALREHEDDPRFHAIGCGLNVGGGENLRYLMQRASGDIMVELGGDDFFASPDALARIVKEYDEHPECEATSGSFVIVPRGGVVCHKPSVLWWKNWCFAKPLTWKRDVGLRVLQDYGEAVVFEPGTGKVPRYGWDVAIYMPIVWQAKQHRTIHDILYAYREHETNDAKGHREDQVATEMRVCKWLDERLMPQVNMPWFRKKDTEKTEVSAAET